MSVLDRFDIVEELLYVRVEKMSNVKVYLYSGTSRENATQSVTPNSRMVRLGESFSLSFDPGSMDDGRGFLLIAIPDEDLDTDFEVSIWQEQI